MDHLEVSQRLESFVRSELEAAEAASVARHLEGCDACRAELEVERHLVEAMASLSVRSRPDFAAGVMAAVAASAEPAWARPRMSAWAWPAAVLAAFAAAAAWIAVNLSATPVGGIVGTLSGMAKASLIAGAGLLGASWRGVSLTVRDAFSGEPASLALLAVTTALAVVGLYRFLLRPRWARAAQGRSPRP
jgi:anti-sigma factor RsiW